MLSIKENYEDSILIKKSKFITFLYRVDDVDEVKSYLSFLSDKYHDATHICYAYIIDSVSRFSDDGEPSGTAGMPILNVLENNNLNHVLLCVVRYFGGIKLGANGLVRAYSGCASDIVSKACIVNLVSGKVCSICFNYDYTKVIDSILKNSIITNRVYDTSVSYIFKIGNSELGIISSQLSKFCKLDIIDNCFIETI